MIERVSFDEQAQTLYIWFRDAGLYVYSGIPADIFTAFCQAPSAGRFFNMHIKGRFVHRRDPRRRHFGPKA